MAVAARGAMVDPEKPAVTVNQEGLLVSQAREGDLKAFSALVELYEERAIHVANSFVGNFEDARDVTQEAFVKAYEHLHSFKENSRFFTWFYRILVNHSKDFLKKKRTRREDADPALLENVETAGQGPGQELANRELESEIHSALDTLPFQQRSAFTLRYLEGLSLEEIAGAMGLSTGGVKAHLWQAAQKMRKTLASYAPNRGCPS